MTADSGSDQKVGAIVAKIDDKAKRLAEFFSGEVVQLDGPLPELLDGDEAAA